MIVHLPSELNDAVRVPASLSIHLYLTLEDSLKNCTPFPPSFFLKSSYVTVSPALIALLNSSEFDRFILLFLFSFSSNSISISVLPDYL